MIVARVCCKAVVVAIAGANFNNNSKVKIVAHKIMYNAITISNN